MVSCSPYLSALSIHGVHLVEWHALYCAWIPYCAGSMGNETNTISWIDSFPLLPPLPSPHSSANTTPHHSKPSRSHVNTARDALYNHDMPRRFTDGRILLP